MSSETNGKTSGERSAERCDLRRKQIFDAASRVFAAKGFHSATVQEVADEAGLGKGTIYEYVRSKKELLFLVVEVGENLFYNTLKDAIDKSQPPDKQLETLLRVSLRFFDAHKEGMRTLIPEVEGHPAKDLARLIASHKKTTEIYRDIIDEGVKSGLFNPVHSFALSKLLFMSCCYWDKLDIVANIEGSVTIDEYEELLTEVFLKGLMKR